MAFIIFGDILLLFFLGFLGWGIFARLRLPVAPFLGSLTVLTFLRALGVNIPLSPQWFFPVLQVLLGLYVGSKITREVVRDIKEIFKTALLVVFWALGVIFLFGPVLASVTSLDLYTSLLSLSMGGLPEITMIALATDADLGFIITMQLIRMVVTVAIFPLILKRWFFKKENYNNKDFKSSPGSETPGVFIANKDPGELNKEGKNNLIFRVLIVLTAAFGGGALLNYLGVPAGIMVGATLAVGAVYLSGIKPVDIPAPVFNVMLLALGIAVADSIIPEKFSNLTAPSLFVPILIATVLIFFSSFLVTLLLQKISGWDLPTCFLAAAPGGFSVMVALSVKYGKDPFKVSILHLCRLLAIKIALPFAFMYLS